MPLPSSVLTRDSLLEIDHLFICVEAAVECSTLTDLGLTSMTEVLRRPQQGTASRSLFFENIYLELIWVEDEIAAQNHAAQSGIDFRSRAQPHNRASPFGMALRQTLDMSHRPFDLLPQPQDFNYSDTFVNFAAANLRLQNEPLCFVIPDAVSLIALLDRTSPIHQGLLNHAAGMKRLTRTTVTIDTTIQLTDSINMLQREGVIAVKPGALPLLELSFDEQVQQKMLDLRWLGIPLVLNY
ncbi:MAG: hypothetical protein HC781_11590 [Leptolyngbyaceae cyanobacterium CSU_1_4]|nr:hypothetical protein [Leptolyngbyaceae cyanobacterium CSU_1_4]